MGEATEDREQLDQAWDHSAFFLFNDANEIFSKPLATPEFERERKLGEAITRLNRQPRTKGNLDGALAQFNELIEENPTDHIGASAKYYAGRIWEMFLDPIDLKKARSIYLELVEANLGHAIGELAAGQIALIDIYQDITEAEALERVKELEKLESYLQTPLGRRHFHSSVGLSLIDRKINTREALRHLVAAEAIGIERRQLEIEVLIALGELNILFDQPSEALLYFEKYLTKYRRDVRHYEITQRVNEIRAGKTETSPAQVPDTGPDTIPTES